MKPRHHVGTLVAEDHCRERSGNIRGEVDDAIAAEWTRHSEAFQISMKEIRSVTHELDAPQARDRPLTSRAVLHLRRFNFSSSGRWRI